MKFLHNICQGRANTIDCQDYITEPAERKKGQHLQREERGAIQHLKRQGYSNRAIAREIGCSPSTVENELRRGTPPRKSNKGRNPATQQGVERPSTRPTGSFLGDAIGFAAARASFVG